MKTLFTFFLLLWIFSVQSQTLPIPAVAAGQGNNYFIAGTGDGGTLTTYNSFLRLHYGLAIGSPYTSNGSGGYVEKATISFDGRVGHINTLGNIGIGKLSPASFSLDISTSGDYQGIQLYHESGRWLRFYSSLPIGGFNGITGQNDSGIIFGNLGGNVDNGFVIAPHQGATSGLRISNNGNIGIGVTTLDSKLAIGGDIRLSGLSRKIIVGTESNVSDYLLLQDVGVGTAAVQWVQDGSAKFTIEGTTGNIGIGTTNPDAKLAVKGNIHAQEVKVDLQGAVAPDYVFEKDYHLPSLESIKSYIDQNKHLPEVPSAKEMEANGVNVGEMNMLLLKKVEELTLFLIEQNRSNEELKKQVEKLTTEMDKLKSK